MLKPPEMRIKSRVYPEFVQNRVRQQKSSKTKNMWASKLAGIFNGKWNKRWREKFEQHGRTKVLEDLQPKGKVRPREADEEDEAGKEHPL